MKTIKVSDDAYRAIADAAIKPPALLEVSPKQLPVLFTYDFPTYESERGLGFLRNEPGLAHLKAQPIENDMP